jgi:hypothetical protein
MELTDPLRLRPGLGVVRRDDRHLQVGLEPPLCVVLPDDPDVRRLLDGLVRGSLPAPRSLPARRALDLLLAADLLVATATATAAPVLAMTHGNTAERRLDARDRYRVALDAPPELGHVLTAALRAAGLRVVAAPGIARPAAPSADVTVVADHGVVSRERLDPLVRHDRPHLVVHGGALGWTVGPFVVPGVTACLRCVDAALSEHDPRRPFVLEQSTRTSVPVDPVLRDLALTWAVRDLQAHADGERPTTWSASVSLGQGLPEVRTWRRHPHCGCAWDVVLTGS